MTNKIFEKSIQIDLLELSKVLNDPSPFKNKDHFNNPYQKLEFIIEELKVHKFNTIDVVIFKYWDGTKLNLNQSIYRDSNIAQLNLIKIINQFKNNNFNVYCMLLGNGIYGTDNEIKTILNDNDPLGLNKDWKMIHLGEKFNSKDFIYGDNPLLLSFHHRDFIEFQKRKISSILRERLFNGIEFAECFFPGWCNLNAINDTDFNKNNQSIAYYGDVNPFIIFNPLKGKLNLVSGDFYTYTLKHPKFKMLSNLEIRTLESLKTFININKDNHEFLVENIIPIFQKISSSDLLYKIWCDFRASVVTIFNKEVSDLISYFNNNNNTKILFNIWILGALGLSSDDLFKYTGIDIKSIIKTVTVNNIVIQTNWSDWDIEYLGTGYILGYNDLFSTLTYYLDLQENTTTSIGLQVDFITKYYRYFNENKNTSKNKTIARGISWFNSISKLAKDIGYNYITGYELSLSINKNCTNEIFFSELKDTTFNDIYFWNIYSHKICTYDDDNNLLELITNSNEIPLYSEPNFNSFVKIINKKIFKNIQMSCYEKNNWFKVILKEFINGVLTPKEYYINPTGEFKMLYCKSEDNKQFAFDSRLVNIVGLCDKKGTTPIILNDNLKTLYLNQYKVKKDSILYTLPNYNNPFFNKEKNFLTIPKGTLVDVLIHGNSNWIKIKYSSKNNSTIGWINDIGGLLSKDSFLNKYYYLCFKPDFSTVNYSLPISKQDLILIDSGENNWLKIETSSQNKWINILGEKMFLNNKTSVYELPTSSSKIIGTVSGDVVKTGSSKNNWTQIEYLTLDNRFNEYSLDEYPSNINNPENNTRLNAYRGWINIQT